MPKKQKAVPELQSLERRITEVEHLLWEVADFNAALVEGIRGYENYRGGLIGSYPEWSKPISRYYHSLDMADMAEMRKSKKDREAKVVSNAR